MAGLYVHLPFCPYLCPYCDFAKWPYRASEAERYAVALETEIDGAPAMTAQTLFFGGGTPSTYAPERIGSLVRRLRARFALPADAEITLEGNPEPELVRALPALRAAGITRLSFGVQSLVDEELRTLGRRHSAQDVERAVALARAAGFTNLSLDLMFAVPGQTAASWARTLDRALALAPEHISTYGLTIEDGTPYADWYAREPERFPTNDEEAEQFAQAMLRLEAAGYEQYEISNFARPGRRCRHNENYWANGEYVGLGVAAASYLAGVRSVTTRDRQAYEAALASGRPVPRESERLTGERRGGEAAMLALRTSEGIELSAFRLRYGVDLLAVFAPAIAAFVRAGHLVHADGRLALTPAGRFVANDVCSAFIGEAQPGEALGAAS